MGGRVSSITNPVRLCFRLNADHTPSFARLLDHNLVSYDPQCFESSNPSNTFNPPSTPPIPPCKPSYSITHAFSLSVPTFSLLVSVSCSQAISIPHPARIPHRFLRSSNQTNLLRWVLVFGHDRLAPEREVCPSDCRVSPSPLCPLAGESTRC